MTSKNSIKNLLFAFLCFSVVTIMIFFFNNGINIVVQNLLYLPIIWACTRYKNVGIIYTIVLVLVYYLLLISFFPTPDVAILGGVRSLIFFLVAGTVRYYSGKEAKERSLLEKNNKSINFLLDSVLAGYWEWDVKKGTHYFSEHLPQMLGYSKNDFLSKKYFWKDIIYKEDLIRLISSYKKHVRSKGIIPFYVEVRYIQKNDATTWILCTGKVTEWDSRNKPLKLIGCHIDLSDKMEQKVIRKSEKLYRKAFESSPIGISLVSLGGTSLKINNQFSSIIGYTQEELRLITFKDYTHPDDLTQDLSLLKKLLAQEISYYQLEKRYYRKDGEIIWVLLNVSLVCRWDGEPDFFVTQIIDITKRKEVERELKELTIRDPLTNLYNRRYIFERIDLILEESRREYKLFSVAIIDIDFFKKINDTYGHLAGDNILKELSKILLNNIRPYDLAGRYGGEEFILVFPTMDKYQSEIVLKRILDDVRKKEILYKEYQLSITFTGGISDNKEASDISTYAIIDRADNRLYKGKKSGRNKIVIG